jgi:glycosyltransferase involved in cell wall biosynthesis
MNLKTVAHKLFKGREDKLPVICIFGRKDIDLVTPAIEDFEEKRLDCRCYSTDSHLDQVLVHDKPSVIITIGKRSSYINMIKAPFEIQKKWLHYDALPDLNQLGTSAYNHYLTNMFDDSQADGNPLVTVFTAAYKTGNNIRRPFCSLRGQTYANWEWVIVDDSDDNGKTFRVLSAIAEQDHRIRVFKPWKHSGTIGEVKNWACSLANGDILLELDHDDELTDYALDCVVRGFGQYIEAGFLYTDCAEIYEDGTSLSYRDGWAFGYGSYADVEYHGKRYKSGSPGNINSKTIRYITSMPNHIRAWRKSFYRSIGGHNKELHVADDYEIMIRTFLKTRMIRVPKLCYLQHIGNTAQQIRNKEIHRHVRSIRTHYDRMIHERFLELGCEDFSWDENNGRSDYTIPNPTVESHAALVSDITSL